VTNRDPRIFLLLFWLLEVCAIASLVMCATLLYNDNTVGFVWLIMTWGFVIPGAVMVHFWRKYRPALKPRFPFWQRR
jgi:hypothetical protein